GGRVYSEVLGVPAEVAVVVGGGTTASSGPNFEAFRWTAATGMVGLGDLQGRAGLSVSSLAQGVSADGSVVVGFGRLRRGVGEFVYDFEPFRWTQAGGMVSLGSLMGQDGEARGVSADGKVIVGNFPGENSPELGRARTEAFRWTAESGYVSLGVLPTAFHSNAAAVSADGSVIVGFSATTSSGPQAFRWTQVEGMVGLGGGGFI